MGGSIACNKKEPKLIGFFGRLEDMGQMTGIAANVVAVAGAVGSGLVLPALGTTIAIQTFQFLHSKYQKGRVNFTILYRKHQEIIKSFFFFFFFWVVYRLELILLHTSSTSSWFFTKSQWW